MTEENPQGDPAPTEPDEPLGEPGKKALEAEREARSAAEKRANRLQEQLDAANKKIASAKDESPEWQKRFEELQEKLDGEITAREKAEKKAAAAERTQYGIDKGLPVALAKRLVGETPEDLDAEIAELQPYVQASGPQPNPQQGNPPQAHGGTLSSGRERFAAKNK